MRRIVLFFVIAALLIVAVNFLGMHSARVYKDSASIICEQKRDFIREDTFSARPGKTNVLFLGASNIMSDVIPAIFDSVMHHQTYSLNLGMPALPVGPTYFAFKDYLERNPAPDYIVMHLYSDNGEDPGLFDKYANQGIGFPGELLSYLVHREDKSVVLNYLLPAHLYGTYILRYSFNFLFNRDHIEQKKRKNRQIISQMRKNRGFYNFDDTQLSEDFTAPGDTPGQVRKYDDFSEDPYVYKLLDLTQKLDVEVMLVIPPVRRNHFRQYQKTPEQFRRIFEEYSNVHAWNGKLRLLYYENRYFCDPDHLNVHGAERYTRQLANRFRELFYEP